MIFFWIVIIVGIAMLLYSIFQDTISHGNLIRRIDSLLEDKANKDALQKAIGLLNKVPNVKKLTYDIQIRYYRVYEAQENWYMAIYHLNEIQKRELYNDETTVIDIHLLKADLYEKMNKHAQSLSSYLAILKIDENHQKANWFAGEMYYKMKNYAEALTFLKKAYELNPDASKNILFALADTCYQQKQYAEAYEIADLVYSNPSEEDETTASEDGELKESLQNQALFLKMRSALRLNKYSALSEMIPILRRRV